MVVLASNSPTASFIRHSGAEAVSQGSRNTEGEEKHGGVPMLEAEEKEHPGKPLSGSWFIEEVDVFREGALFKDGPFDRDS